MAKMNMSHSIVVDAPIDEVFDAFCNPQIMSEWFASEVEIRGYEPPLAVGKEHDEVSKFMGREMVSKCVVTKIEPPHLYVRTMNGPASGEIQQVVEAVEAGVKVSVIFNGEMKGFLAALAAPLIKAQAKKQMEKDLDSFKAYIES
jgi:uncharacterized protein YndB with AHSA1/START domain